MFLGLLDPNPDQLLVQGTVPDPAPLVRGVVPDPAPF
jgi:hypothetical protein